MHEVTDILTTLIVSLYIDVRQNAKLYPTNMYNYNVSFENIKKNGYYLIKWHYFAIKVKGLLS